MCINNYYRKNISNDSLKNTFLGKRNSLTFRVYERLNDTFSKKDIYELTIKLQNPISSARGIISTLVRAGYIEKTSSAAGPFNIETFAKTFEQPVKDNNLGPDIQDDTELICKISELTDMELMNELASRGYRWEKMTVTKTVNYNFKKQLA